MFPPHYLLNPTFHAECWMVPIKSSGHQTTIHVSTPILAECYIFMLNIGCYQPEFRAPHISTPLLAECYISWMLQTRVQGTRLPYTFPPHYLLNVTFHRCYQPEFRAPDYHTRFHPVTPLLAECWMLPTKSSGHQTTIHVSTPLLAECYISC